MDRTALVGLALATAGVVGLLAVELVVPAEASLQGGRSYLVAISAGSGLQLDKADASIAASSTRAAPIVTGSILDVRPHKRLSCNRVVDAGFMAVGYSCR